MLTISPRLGPGLWQAGCAAAGNISRQLRGRSGRLSDDLVGYGPAVLADSSVLARWDGRALAEKKGIHVWDSGDLDGSAEYLAELGAPAVAIRPGKYSVYRCGSSGHNRNGVLRNEVWEDSGEVRMGARRHAGAR